MASKYWIKLYHEILDDPKMGLLPDNVWRRAIELFLLAGELDNDGQLPDTRGIAWKLRIPCNETLQKELETLRECNILALQDDNTWVVIHFKSRQSKVEVADRVRQFRKRQREKAEKEPIKPKKDYVTKRYIDTDIDKDIKEEKEATAAFAQISSFYQNEIGPLSPLIRDKLLELCTSYPAEWIKLAISGAVEQNARKISYVRGTLENWQACGGPQNDKPKGQYKNGATNGTHRQTYNSSHTHATSTDPDRIPSVNIYDDTG